MAKFETVLLSDLYLDTENARHDIIENQPDIIKWMLESIGDKLHNLAKHIVENGLSPIEQTMVMPLKSAKDGYVVLEGNRRITALKILHEPALCTTERDRKRFSALAKTAKELTTKLQVAIVKDREEADVWIRLRHQGEQSGVGTVPWGPASTERYNNRMNRQGQDAYAIQVLDYSAQTELVQPNIRDNVPTSTLSRLMRDPYVRERLGIHVGAGIMRGRLDQEELNKALAYILQELGTGAVKVGRVMGKDDRRSYIEDVIKTAAVDTGRLVGGDYSLKDAGAKFQAGKKSKRRKKDKAPSIARATLIPSSFKMSINDTRLNDIYNELKGLNVEDYTNAVAVTFRLFIEALVKTYLSNTDLKWSPQSKKNEELYKQLRRVATELEQAEKLSSEQTKPVLTACSDPNAFFSTNTFNAYVHNLHMHPMAGDLKRSWDNFQYFILALEGSV